MSGRSGDERCALRTRVDERQKERGTIGSQLELLSGRARRGDDLVAEFVDDGNSGARLDRPALDRLRDAAEAGALDAGCLCPDRLTRVYAYQVLILEELERFRVPVQFLDGPALGDDPQAKLLVQVQGVIAAYERAKIAERYRRGKLHRARAGEAFFWKVPYGYQRVAAQDERPAPMRDLLRDHADPRDRRRRRAAASSREARSHPQHRAREPRAAVGAPGHRPARTHAVAAALRDRRPRRRGPAPERRDLDIPGKRARTRSKGGDVDWLLFGSGSARLLPRLIDGRRAGPVFLSSLRPSPARAQPPTTSARSPATRDCPTAARPSCSSRRPAGRYISSVIGADAPRRGQRAATATDGREPHRSLRTQQRYTRPGPNAVAALTAAHGLARRR